jgi:non-homologous end joining protein Ku
LNPGKAPQEKKTVRKLIAFDDDTFDKLKQLGRDRMATVQELADEAFTDVLRKHGIPIDLKDALRKSVSLSKAPAKKTPPNKNAKSRHQGNADHDDRSGSVRRRPARGTKEHSG